MYNLVQNGIDEITNISNGKTSIKAYKTNDNKTEISVSDNGMGIPEETIEKVFIPFFTTKEKGSGIGLSLSRQIIRMHGGTIDLKSKKGEGTCVTIKI